MKKINFMLIVLFTSTLFAQTTTIDYSGLTSTDCNVFAFDTTINGVIHHTTKGSPTLPNGAVIMDYNYGTGNQKGTGYQINYNFEDGYKYIITITAKNGNSSASGATLQARFGSDGSNSDCLGSVNVSNNGGQFFNPITGTSYNPYTIDTGFLSSSQSIMSFLTMSTGSTPNPATQTLYIQKITVEKIAPQMSFSLSPTSASIACGDTSAKTFTVTPVGVPSSSTVTYQWSYSGWTQVSSTSTSKTLQPTSGTTLPSSVSVTPYVNGVAQPTMTCSVSRAAFTSSATITGSGTLCTATTANYSLTGLLSGQTVTWSSSNTAVATVSNSTNSSVTVNKVGVGSFNLIATILNSCGQTTTKPFPINVGVPQFNNFAYGTSTSSQSLCLAGPSSYSYSIPQLNSTDKIIANFVGLTTAEAGVTTNWQWTTSSNIIVLNGSKNTRNMCTLAPGTATISVRVKNSCGWSDWATLTVTITELPLVINKQSKSKIYKVFPNPSNDVVNIELKDQNNQSLKSTIITGELFDMTGQSKTRVEIIDSKATFSVKGLNKGVYALKIHIDGQVESHQIVVE